jgi:hypothetical protein
MNIVFKINNQGDISCLWTEALPLVELGRMEINRASAVEFNADSQQWEVRLEGSNKVDFSHPSRAVCIGWEIETINGRLAEL